MTSSGSTISRSSIIILIRIIWNSENIFRSNISNFFAYINYLSYWYYKIRRNMWIRNIKIISFYCNSTSISTLKSNKSDLSICYRIYVSILWGRNINARMSSGSTRNWRFPRTKWRSNCVKSRNWPKKIVIREIIIGIKIFFFKIWIKI